MKTAIKVLYRSLGGAAGAAILFVNFSVFAQSLFVSSYTPGVVDKITPGRRLSTFASGLSYPFGMAFDHAGNLFVANSANDGPPGSIVEILPGGEQTTFATGVDPKGLAFSREGDLFESDYHSGIIYRYAPDGERSVFASGLDAPQALAFDRADNLFVSAGYGDGNQYITEITPDGKQIRFASGLSGSAGLAFNRAGDLFEADTDSGNIYKFTPDGRQSTFVSGLKGPVSLAFNGAGDLFVGVSVDNGSGGYIDEIAPDGRQRVIASGIVEPTGLAIQPVLIFTVRHLPNLR